MKQVNIDPDKVIEVDYQGAAKALKPVVYKKGKSFCCLYGADAKSGVSGCGKTPVAALKDWDVQLQKRLKQGDQNDEVVKAVKTILSKQNEALPKHVQDFYAQFHPLKRK